MELWRNRLGRRIVYWLLASMAALTVFAAVFQLSISYQRDEARILDEFEIIERNFKESLEIASSNQNLLQIDALLNGIFAQSDVRFLELRIGETLSWQRGESAEDLIDRTYALFQPGTQDAERMVIGALEVGVSLAALETRFWSEFVTLLLFNSLKMLVAAGIMLFIFDRLVARHLRDIAHQSATRPWMAKGSDIQLGRADNRRSDELDEIVMALNNARADVRETLLAQSSSRDAKLRPLPPAASATAAPPPPMRDSA